MTSISYFPERCSSQIVSRFRRAAAARALWPAMYSLKIHSFGRRRPSAARFLGISLSESEWLTSTRRNFVGRQTAACDPETLLIGCMAHAARFDNQQLTVAATTRCVAQKNPRIHQRRHPDLDVLVEACGRACPRNQVCEHGGDLLRLQIIDEANQRRVNLADGSATKTRQRINHHDRRPELIDVSMHGREVRFQSVERRPGSVDAEETFLYPSAQVHADRTHVPNVLGRRFFKGEGERAQPTPTGRIHEMPGDARLPSPRRARDEDAAALEVSAVVEHAIQPP